MNRSLAADSYTLSEEQLGAADEEVDGVGDNLSGEENVQSKGDEVELEVCTG